MRNGKRDSYFEARVKTADEGALRTIDASLSRLIDRTDGPAKQLRRSAGIVRQEVARRLVAVHP